MNEGRGNLFFVVSILLVVPNTGCFRCLGWKNPAPKDMPARPAAGAQQLRVVYTVSNQISGDGREFDETLKLNTTKQTFMEIMVEAAKINPIFQFTTWHYEGIGHYVRSINGVYENPTEKTYWAWLKQRSEDPADVCSHGSSIDTYTPADGEHTVFRLSNYDNGIAACETN